MPLCVFAPTCESATKTFIDNRPNICTSTAIFSIILSIFLHFSSIRQIFDISCHAVTSPVLGNGIFCQLGIAQRRSLKWHQDYEFHEIIYFPADDSGLLPCLIESSFFRAIR